jgi:hypothetical protein
VGDVFIKNVIFSTDVGQNTISLAKRPANGAGGAAPAAAAAAPAAGVAPNNAAVAQTNIVETVADKVANNIGQ